MKNYKVEHNEIFFPARNLAYFFKLFFEPFPKYQNSLKNALQIFFKLGKLYKVRRSAQNSKIDFRQFFHIIERRHSAHFIPHNETNMKTIK